MLTIYVFIIFIIIILLYKLETFEFIKVMKESGVGIPVVALHQATSVNNILDLIIEQKKLLVDKSKEGLYLPYKTSEINKSFMALGVPMLLIMTLIIGIIFKKSIWDIGITSLLYSIVCLISLSFQPKKHHDVFRTFTYFIVFGISLLFIS